MRKNWHTLSKKKKKESSNEYLSKENYSPPWIKDVILRIFFFRCAAKFLWKRIPESIKADHPELQKIWSVGMALWERNLPEAYAALNQTWSEGVSSIMKAVKGNTKYIHVWYSKNVKHPVLAGQLENVVETHINMIKTVY